jgi:D-sedoheptulose 7-phosphate isomerase
MTQDITSFFTELNRILAHTEVTDRQGNLLGLDKGAEQAVNMILETSRCGAKVMAMGNGGSAAIASHFHNDLCKAAGIRSLAFYDTPLLTALANDHGYACVFERPLEMWAEKQDLAVIISSSGESENILRAGASASRIGCRIITFSGFNTDNSLRKLGDINFYLSSKSYGFVEVGHSVIAHFLTDQAMLSARC